MILSKFTDYSFRILIYLSTHRNELSTVEKISVELKISENHIKKIVHILAKKGYILSLKGRNGGIRLGKNASEINLGDVLVFCEDFTRVVECNKNGMNCTYNNDKCLIKNIVRSATEKFINEFRKYTLLDAVNLIKN